MVDPCMDEILIVPDSEWQELAARGAAHLDKKQPGWALCIDMSLLNMQWYEDCVVGQLAAGEGLTYWKKLRRLGIRSARGAMDLGFALGTISGGDPIADDDDPDYMALTRAWLIEIQWRRTIGLVRP